MYYPVPDRWNAQRPLPSIGLGNIPAPYHLRPVLACSQLGPELFKEARTLARSSGDRISEFQAHEYLAMMEIERGRHQAAREHSAALIELGDRLREGSERPFAHALYALCDYAIADDAKMNCPVSRALSAVPIELDASLD